MMDVQAGLSATIGEAFEQACAEHHDRVAIQGQDGACSYGALQEEAHFWASRLGDAADPLRPVAIVMPRGRQLVAAMLGAAIAGRSWTVMPPASAAVLRRSFLAVGPCLLIADGMGADITAAIEGLDVRRPGASAAGCNTGGVAASAAACIAFSSGSTGMPKGVVLRHDATVANARIGFGSLGLTPEHRYLWLSAVDSTASNTAIFTPLLHGGCLLPFDLGAHGFSALADWIETARASVFHGIPGLFRRFLGAVRDARQLGSIEVVKLGGEMVFPSDVKIFRDHLPQRSRLFNGLGMSEANGNVCHEPVDPGERLEVVPVGRPLPGFTLSLAGPDGGTVGRGEPGRLRIAGPNLAAGYWDASNTAVVAFADAGPDAAGGRQFQTEDWCRQAEDGRFIHLGRSDGMVKIRGKRVHLMAVESALRSIDGVAEVLVQQVAAESGEMSIRAWVEPQSKSGLDASTIRARLAETVAPEAIPGSLQVLDRLPQLPSGKLDRKRLFDSPLEPLSLATGHPAEAGQARMADLFAMAMNRTSFPVDGDFFEAGGDSLAAVTLATSVETEWQCCVDPALLAAHPTPQGLLQVLGGSDIRPAYRLSVAGDGPPLWIAGGAGDPIFSLLPFARALQGHGPIYGFATGVDAAGRPSRRVAAMTEPLLEVMLRVQPDGPYLLAGTSFGGWLAFDLALRLRAIGKEIAFLGMIDAAGPGYPAFRKNVPVNARRIQWERNFFRRYYLGPPTGKIAKRVAGLGRRLLTWARLFAGSDVSRLSPMAKTWLVEEACLRARNRYAPGMYDGTITALQAESPLRSYHREDPALGWQAHSSKPVRTYPITGNHGLHMQSPNVAGLAQTLCAAINETLAW